MPDVHACWKCGHDAMMMSSFQLKAYGDVQIFYVQCPRCGLRSAPRISFKAAISEWNDIPEDE